MSKIRNLLFAGMLSWFFMPGQDLIPPELRTYISKVETSTDNPSFIASQEEISVAESDNSNGDDSEVNSPEQQQQDPPVKQQQVPRQVPGQVPAQVPDKSDVEMEEYRAQVEALCELAQEREQCKAELTEIGLQRFKTANEYAIWVYSHHQLTFRIRSIIDVLMFIIVIFIVTTGLHLSYLEFRKEDSPETKLSLAKGNIEIDSNIIGLIILIVSLVFFYLYVIHIRPIRVVETSKNSNNQSLIN